jgi:hypothetical protein
MSDERRKKLERISKLKGRGWAWHEQELIAEACREIRRLRAFHKEAAETLQAYCDRAAWRDETIEGHEAAMRGAILHIEDFSNLYGPGTAPGLAASKLRDRLKEKP